MGNIYERQINGGQIMAELEIKGKTKYIKRMYKHLRKEHPSTKKRMTIDLEKKKVTKRKGFKSVTYWRNLKKKYGLKPFGQKFK